MQKEVIIPEVGGQPVTSWDAADSFLTDPIEFEHNTPWLVQFDGWSGVTAGSPVGKLLVSNVEDGDYIDYTVSYDLTIADDRIIYDQMYPGRWMKIQYTSGGSTGTFDLTICK